MFTMVDFERARSATKRGGILESLLFSIEKSEFAYSMNLCDSHDRGTYAERLVGHKLIDNGFDIRFYGADSDFDLLINNSIRAEVKLGTIQPNGKNKTKYVFHKIKPELFDTLFMVFLNPHGIIIKWTTSEMVSEWSVDYKRGKDGYSMSFDDNMKSKRLVYDESLKSFIDLYA